MPNNTKEKPLGAELDSELVDAFLKQVESRGFKKKRALGGALKVWISLPTEIQAKTLDDAFGENVFSGLLHYLINNEISQMGVELRTQLQNAKTPAI